MNIQDKFYFREKDFEEWYLGENFANNSEEQFVNTTFMDSDEINRLDNKVIIEVTITRRGRFIAPKRKAKIVWQ